MPGTVSWSPRQVLRREGCATMDQVHTGSYVVSGRARPTSNRKTSNEYDRTEDLRLKHYIIAILEAHGLYAVQIKH